MVYKLQLLKCPYEVYIEQGSSNLEKLDFREIIYFILMTNLGTTAELLLNLSCQFRENTAELLLNLSCQFRKMDSDVFENSF